MATIGQFLCFVGLTLLGIGLKWGIAWALFGGFVALLLLCALPILRFFFDSVAK
ncbi:hypothetical protein [Dechloromonas denitrificans]|uniref:hypothetical protein n=1 Tax=Dechloromonas denitrificans TaxID=281362 RepID=UPI0012FB70E3|nr:hypothetical protein [Dechloromonas denitrificans]